LPTGPLACAGEQAAVALKYDRLAQAISIKKHLPEVDWLGALKSAPGHSRRFDDVRAKSAFLPIATKSWTDQSVA
jgi:hypothetical protein